MNRYDIDRAGAERATAARMLVASVLWIGLAGLVVIHVDREVSTDAVFSAPAPGDAPACARRLPPRAGGRSVRARGRPRVRPSRADDAIPPFPTF